MKPNYQYDDVQDVCKTIVEDVSRIKGKHPRLALF